MFKLFLAVTYSTALVQCLNLLYTKQITESTGTLGILKVVIMTIPLQVLISFGYAYYFSAGNKQEINYIFLSLVSTGLGILFSFIVGAFFLNNKSPNTYEIAGCLLTIIGIGILISSKK